MARPKFKDNEYKFINDQTIEMQLSQGMTCLVDAADYDLVKMHRWYYHKSKSNSGYVKTNITNNGKCTKLLMHSLIMNFPEKPLEIDHINLNGCDNRRSNLRICTHQQNNLNKTKHKNNTSGFKGVTYFKRDNKFAARIMFNKKSIHLGYFDTAAEAAKAYDAKAIELYGEFKVLNFPQ
jgi:hypothetical protein